MSLGPFGDQHPRILMSSDSVLQGPHPGGQETGEGPPFQEQIDHR